MPKRHVEPIRAGRITLRLLQEADLPTTLAWRNQDRIRTWFFTSGVISAEQHRAWFERYQKRDDDFVFIIEETQELRAPVGQAALYHVEWAARRAEFGRLVIGEASAQGLGLGRLATSALTRLALFDWALDEVYLNVLDANTRAIAIYEQCGFVATERHEGAVRMICRRDSVNA